MKVEDVLSQELLLPYVLTPGYVYEAKSTRQWTVCQRVEDYPNVVSILFDKV